MLTGSLDYETTLASLARLVAGTLADWCEIDLVEDGGEIRRLVVAHVDPALEPAALELQERPLSGELPRRSRACSPTPTRMVAEADEVALARVARGEEQTRLVTELGIRSAMIVPLVGRGHVLGALTLVRAAGERTRASISTRLRGWPVASPPRSIRVGSIAAPCRPARGSPASSRGSTASCGRPIRPRSGSLS